MKPTPNAFLLGITAAAGTAVIVILGIFNLVQWQTILRLRSQPQIPAVQVFPYPSPVPLITEPTYPPLEPEFAAPSPEPNGSEIPQEVSVPGRVTQPVAPNISWARSETELITALRDKLSAAAHQPYLLADRRSDVHWWTEPQQLPLDETTLRSLSGIPAPEKIDTSVGPLEQIGEFIAGPYLGYQAVLLHTPGMGDWFEFYARDPKTGRGVLLPRYPFDFIGLDSNVTVRLNNIDTEYRFPDLEYPETVELLPGLKLQQTERSIFGGPTIFSEEQVDRVVEASFLGDLYYDSGFHAFVVKTKTGHTVAYTTDIPFVAAAADDRGSYQVQSLAITWWYGSSTAEYLIAKLGGCGSTNARDVAYNVEREQLVQAGITATGNPIYEYQNLTAEPIQKLYREWYVPFESQKLPYAEFVTNHPLFFWVDQLGRLNRFTHGAYLPGVECGKPAIYLYPETTERVRVEVDPRGGFTHTEPPYGSGWNVIATPEGKLTDIATGKTYPYLWWDGRGGLYRAPDRFWVVGQPEVEPFLRQTLPQLGLTANETADFLEYWLPFFTPNYPYYEIGFHGTAVMNELAPLSVQPQPDTVIRILMDYEGLTKQMPEQPPRIVTPERRGFTILEWGGVRH